MQRARIICEVVCGVLGVYVSSLGVADQDRVILRSVKTNGNFGIQIHVVTLDNAAR